MKSMKNMKTLTIILATLGTSSAWAQNPTNDIAGQITRSRDYAQSMINSMGSVPADRFNETPDYARIGPKLNVAMQEKLEAFRLAMTRLATSSFTASVNEYNRIANDQTLDPKQKQADLEVRRKILTQQAELTSTMYALEIASLYTFAPELTGVNVQYLKRGTFLIYADGTNEMIVERNDYAKTYRRYFIDNAVREDNYELNHDLSAFKPTYATRLTKFVKANCNETRSCVGNLIGQLSEYILYVENFLNKPIVLQLADRTSITIADLRTNPGSAHSALLSNSITNFRTDPSYGNLR